MTAIEPFRRLHQHSAWVNRNLLDAAVTLTDEQRKKEFPIGQGSIWKSLLHLYGAEYVWFECLMGNESEVVPGDVPGKLPGNQLGEGAITDIPELRQKWEALEKRYTDYLTALTPDSLEETVFRHSLALLARIALRRSDALLHICTHAHYTAAQVVNMIRQCGAALPQTMLMALVRQESM